MTTFSNACLWISRVLGSDVVLHGSKYDVQGQHSALWKEYVERVWGQAHTNTETATEASSQKQTKVDVQSPVCKSPQIRMCQRCKLIYSEDLCKLHNTHVCLPHDEIMKQPAPPTGKGALPDFWIHRPINKLSVLRDNSRYIGYYNADAVFEQIAMGCRVEPWEYRCYMEDVARIEDDPDFIPQNRRIYVGDDNRIRESELDHYKDGGYAENSDGHQDLVTPYDAGLEPDPELDEKLQEQYGTPDMWKQQGVAHHVVYQHSYHTNYVIAGSYSRRVEKVVYQPERVWFMQGGRPLYADIETRQVVEYREDNTVMRKQELPTLHPIMAGQEKCVVASSTIRTRKDKRFLEVRRYEKQVVERHRQLLIHRDEVESDKRAIPA